MIPMSMIQEVLMMVVAGSMLNRKFFFPWLCEQDDDNKVTERALEEKDRKIRMLEKENAELKKTKAVYITQIERVDTYVNKTDSVTNYVSIAMKDDTKKLT